jgi:hypothetical protein
MPYNILVMFKHSCLKQTLQDILVRENRKKSDLIESPTFATPSELLLASGNTRILGPQR